MELKRFFSFEPIKNNRIVLKGNEFFHAVKVCRLKKGFKIIVNNNTENDYYCTIENIEKTFLTAVIDEIKVNDTFADTNITLFIAMCKDMDTVVQKAVEMGVTRLVPFFSKNTNEKKLKKDRLEKIVLESSKQCGRPNLMVLEDICEFEDAIERAQEFDKALIYFELEREEKTASHLSPKDEKLGIMIGSEGGFDLEEIQKAEKAGWKTATLGKRILRVATAVVAALALCLQGMDKI
ncbi:MAG: RsmE family RNA methyltransferase [Bacillota bacterium]|nr:RsmE family RNA methyltransferase [Bacillota bacterium]HHU43609.1 16S rRNA (uracil(1498)-N(3))-methyltransferase [Clostridiales bacterium]